MDKITIISSNKNWLEHSALSQLNSIASLEGVVKAVGLPDLHPGKTPVGAAVITEDLIYPHLVGNDIGCGMSMFMTGVEKKKFKLDKLIKKAENIHDLRDISLTDSDNGLYSSSPMGSCLGTIGGGNHFAEFQEVDTIYDNEHFNKMGFDKNHIMLLVHSGSRGYGQLIFDESIRQHNSQKGLLVGSDGYANYISSHDDAVRWAGINRRLISHRVLKAFGMAIETNELVNCVHNNIEPKVVDGKVLYIHRKGATSGDHGPVIIPGSRGSLTYLVKPSEDNSISAYSLAHGAGRKWERGMCKARLEGKYTKETIMVTKLKSRIVCNETNLLYEEAPEAYKSIETVIQSLLDYKLIRVIATFKPMLTYKA